MKIQKILRNLSVYLGMYWQDIQKILRNLSVYLGTGKMCKTEKKREKNYRTKVIKIQKTNEWYE